MACAAECANALSADISCMMYLCFTLPLLGRVSTRRERYERPAHAHGRNLDRAAPPRRLPLPREQGAHHPSNMRFARAEAWFFTAWARPAWGGPVCGCTCCIDGLPTAAAATEPTARDGMTARLRNLPRSSAPRIFNTRLRLLSHPSYALRKPSLTLPTPWHLPALAHQCGFKRMLTSFHMLELGSMLEQLGWV
jgi:hypothetical protein